ncbi:hypothetical protein ZWY2020_001977 [Hordeum vulgare]|nr:hypothetical protein ZWY2020_001977 [Hordeum vulgare]
MCRGLLQVPCTPRPPSPASFFLPLALPPCCRLVAVLCRDLLLLPAMLHASAGACRLLLLVVTAPDFPIGLWLQCPDVELVAVAAAAALTASPPASDAVAVEGKTTVLVAEKLGAAGLALLWEFANIDCSYDLSPEGLRAKISLYQCWPRRLRGLRRPSPHRRPGRVRGQIDNGYLVANAPLANTVAAAEDGIALIGGSGRDGVLLQEVLEAARCSSYRSSSVRRKGPRGRDNAGGGERLQSSGITRKGGSGGGGEMLRLLGVRRKAPGGREDGAVPVYFYCSRKGTSGGGGDEMLQASGILLLGKMAMVAARWQGRM